MGSQWLPMRACDCASNGINGADPIIFQWGHMRSSVGWKSPDEVQGQSLVRSPPKAESKRQK